jgi:hypothetical protein
MSIDEPEQIHDGCDSARRFRDLSRSNALDYRMNTKRAAELVPTPAEEDAQYCSRSSWRIYVLCEDHTVRHRSRVFYSEGLTMPS